MKRDPRAFLSDVIEAGHAIQQAVACINLNDYCNSRLIRSSVEREFTLNDQLVWGVIQDNLPALLKQCTKLLSVLDGGDA
ncbi:hypothetical protein KBY65_09180 [Cyanobium sp. Alchichica 3B3-8F6]|uniref:HepT-like ribonuclease domain-containing protein n=1 Tax=Cyanobium sp. Alchichica 3B3-8F6 TaxID=2823696 RepID=UPI0020CDD28D|nr:hypothetical protein [Cyanobium sp. Alchichica 3B3-8F6]MCP9882653.1 hypothetical protein [Cyanobium sp. Alchichica 3B3-8F6]